MYSFNDLEKSLERQSQELSTLIATRAAVRVLPLTEPKNITLFAARSILTSGVVARMPTSETKRAARAANASYYPLPSSSAIQSRTQTAPRFAAQAAFLATITTFDPNTADISGSAISTIQSCSAALAAFAQLATPFDDLTPDSAAIEDLSIPYSNLFSTPIWHAFGEPRWHELSAPVEKRFFQIDPHWSFWRDWYQGYLTGNHVDWELQRRVALIPDEDWEKGPEHIAEKIEEIREEFGFKRAARQERYKELEPSSVEHLLSAPTISAAQIEAAAHDISEASYRYLNDTGANELPEAFQMFPTLSRSLLLIGRKLRESELTPSKEEQLRQEVGRLNAHVRELEKQIANLQASGDPVFRIALKEQAARSLGDWKMYAAMLGAVWMISGDTVGMKTRLENLAAARDAIFGASNTPLVEPTDELWRNPEI